MAQAHRPGFVTMDLTMPRMDGPACLDALRTVLPQARILVVSALADRSTALKAMTRGAHGFLLKPFSDDQLVLSLRELMA
jgi:two-component system chemotaxis response regulator CheY